MSLEERQVGPISVKGRHYRWPLNCLSKADMQRNLIAIGLAATLSACASTSLTTTRSTEATVETAEGRSIDGLLLDGMHPNEAGHAIEAEALLEVIRREFPKGK